MRLTPNSQAMWDKLNGLISGNLKPSIDLQVKNLDQLEKVNANLLTMNTTLSNLNIGKVDQLNTAFKGVSVSIKESIKELDYFQQSALAGFNLLEKVKQISVSGPGGDSQIGGIGGKNATPYLGTDIFGNKTNYGISSNSGAQDQVFIDFKRQQEKRQQQDNQYLRFQHQQEEQEGARRDRDRLAINAQAKKRFFSSIEEKDPNSGLLPIIEAIGGGTGGIAGYAGARAGFKLGGVGGAALGATALPIVAQGIEESFNAIKESLLSAAQAGLVFQRSLLGISGTLSQASQFVDSNGNALPIDQQVGLQNQRARGIQLAARGKAAQVGIGGEAESSLVQAILTGFGSKGIQLNAEQAATLTQRFGAALNIFAPELASNPTIVRKDLFDITAGLGQASRTALGSRIPKVIEEIKTAKTAEQAVKATESLEKLVLVFQNSDNAITQIQRFSAIIEITKTNFGEAIVDKITPGIKQFVEILNSNKVNDALISVGTSIGETTNQIIIHLANLTKSLAGLSNFLGGIALPGRGKETAGILGEQGSLGFLGGAAGGIIGGLFGGVPGGIVGARVGTAAGFGVGTITGAGKLSARQEEIAKTSSIITGNGFGASGGIELAGGNPIADFVASLGLREGESFTTDLAITAQELGSGLSASKLRDLDNDPREAQILGKINRNKRLQKSNLVGLTSVEVGSLLKKGGGKQETFSQISEETPEYFIRKAREAVTGATNALTFTSDESYTKEKILADIFQGNKAQISGLSQLDKANLNNALPTNDAQLKALRESNVSNRINLAEQNVDVAKRSGDVDVLAQAERELAAARKEGYENTEKIINTELKKKELEAQSIERVSAAGQIKGSQADINIIKERQAKLRGQGRDDEANALGGSLASQNARQQLLPGEKDKELNSLATKFIDTTVVVESFKDKMISLGSAVEESKSKILEFGNNLELSALTGEEKIIETVRQNRKNGIQTTMSQDTQLRLRGLDGAFSDEDTLFDKDRKYSIGQRTTQSLLDKFDRSRIQNEGEGQLADLNNQYREKFGAAAKAPFELKNASNEQKEAATKILQLQGSLGKLDFAALALPLNNLGEGLKDLIPELKNLIRTLPQAIGTATNNMIKGS